MNKLNNYVINLTVNAHEKLIPNDLSGLEFCFNRTQILIGKKGWLKEENYAEKLLKMELKEK